MKKFSIIMLLTLLVSFPSYCFAYSAKDHIKFCTYMKDVSTFFGGLDGKLDESQLKEIQKMIDGTIKFSGSNHRNDLSHDVKTLTKMIIEKHPEWNQKLVENVIRIHNVADMQHETSKGVNGWEKNNKRKNQAEKLLNKIQAGKRIYWWPSWTSTTGPNINPKPTKVQESVNQAKLTKYLDTIFRYGPVKTIFSISTKAVPYVKWIIVVYETGKIAIVSYEQDEIHIQQIIELGAAWTGGVTGGLVGSAIALKVCAPLSSVPTIGPILYGGSVLCIGLASAYGGEKIATFVISNVSVVSEQLFPEQTYEMYGFQVFMYEI
jgi:hypothetical protein